MEKKTAERLTKIKSALSKSGDFGALAGLLSDSLFYYCAGKDPSPIIAFYKDYPLFIYSDLLKHRENWRDETVGVLFRRLREHGFTVSEVEYANLLDGGVTALCEKEGASLLILYIRGDAWRCYKEIYGEEYLPSCIANYRYEMNSAPFGGYERLVKRIIGHAFTGVHRVALEIPYFGDYQGEAVKVYERDEEF